MPRPSSPPGTAPAFGLEILDLAKRLRTIAHCGGEVKGRFARPLFSRLTITNAPGPMAPHVAELAVAFALHAVRRIDEYREALRRPSNRIYDLMHLHGGGRRNAARSDGRARRPGPRRPGGGGAARAVRRAAARARPVRLPAQVGRCGGKAAKLEPLLRAASSVVILAAALTDATRGMLDARRLSLLPDGATVVNVARGGLLDLGALTREVRRGRARAALDVTDPAEPLPRAIPCGGCAGPWSRPTWGRRRGRCGTPWPTSSSTTSSAPRGERPRNGSPPAELTG